MPPVVGGLIRCLLPILIMTEDLDLATANSGYNHNGENISVLLNNGDGTFAAPTTYNAGYNPMSVFVSDINGDGNVDLVVANYTSNNVSKLMNNGDGTFADLVTYATGTQPASVFASDLDDDGELDLAVANSFSNNISILGNNGDGTFSNQVIYAVCGGPISIFASDFDGDGDLDLVTANPNSDSISVLFNENSGCQYTIGDINGNGTTNGIDVSYGINYFKGGAAPPIICDMCPEPQPFYAAGDVNGNCAFNGIDLSYFVNYLKGGAGLMACGDCSPVSPVLPTPSIKPVSMPVIKEKLKTMSIE